MEKTIGQARKDKKATLDSFKVKRDGEGKLIPIERETAYGAVMVIPMTYGDAERWAREMKKADDVSAERLAEQFQQFIIEPDMSKVTGDSLRKDFKPLAIQELLMAIIHVSGLEKQISATVNPDGTAKIEVKNE